MRVVLDTNVLVSALLSASGPPAWVLESVLTGHLELAYDARIREEYEDVLERAKFRFSAAQVSVLLATLDQVALHVPAVPPWPLPLPDPDDEPFLAVAGLTSSVLVTGNLRHYPAARRGGVLVLTPRGVVERSRRGAP